LNKNTKPGDKHKIIYVYKLERDNSKGWKIAETMNGIEYETPTKITSTPKYTNPKRNKRHGY
jgi:hypothetical protein